MMCRDCGLRPAVARGRCRRCYNIHDRSTAVTEPLPGLMTPAQASERRARLIRQMRAEGYEAHEIAERFGGRTRTGEER